MKPSELRKMISTIVKEELRAEIRKLAPVIIEEFLTEKYLKQLVERRVSESRSFGEELDADRSREEEDRIPRPQDNEDEGIYQDHVPSRRSEGNDVVAKLVSRDNPWAMVYEGTRPIKSDVSPDDYDTAPEHISADAAQSIGESQARFGEEGVPIGKLGKSFANRMTELVNGANKRSLEKKPIVSSAQAEEKRIQMLREKLDSRPVSTPKVG